jgi:hypothetical protein
MGVPPRELDSSVGESATDDNAADARARPRDAGMIRKTGPGAAVVVASTVLRRMGATVGRTGDGREAAS